MNGTVHLFRQSNWSNVASLEGPLIAQGAGVDSLGRVVVYAGFDPENGDAGGARPYTIADGYVGEVAQRDENAPVAYCAFAQDNLNRLYTLGGRRVEGNVTTAVDRYDAASDTWSALASMLSAVGDAAGVYDGQGHVLVIGGVNAAGTQRTGNVARYDIASNSWSDSAVPDMPVATSGLRALLGADGRVYAMGGKIGPVNSGSVVATVWVLDVNTNTWAPNPGGDMLTPRQHFGAVLNALNSTILVIGGENDSGGTNLCETLYTPRCPTIINDTSAHAVWAGSNGGMTAVFAGGDVMTYQWFREGVALHDGELGGRVSGSQSSTLTISSIVPTDAAMYHVVASNPCGSMSSTPAMLSVRQLPSGADMNKWTWQTLHPTGSPQSSSARGVAQGRVVGEITTGPNPLYPSRSYFTHAAYWERPSGATTFVMHDINNPATVQSGIYAISPDGTKAVGYWYKPYTVPVYGLGFNQRPYSWTFNIDGSITEDDLWCRAEYGAAQGTDGVRTVGFSFGDYGDPGYQEYWGPHPYPFVPGSMPHSFASVGMGYVLGSLNNRPTIWNGATAIDMTPPGATAGWVAEAADGQFIGSATLGAPHAVIWDGAAPGVITDLGSNALLYGVHGGLQVGSNGSHAAIWAGSIASMIDLHSLLPTHFSISGANAVWMNESTGEIIVVGQALNSASVPTMYNAIVWVYNPATGVCPADFNASANATVQDIFDFLSAWFAGNTRADFNGVAGLTVQDIFDFLAAWFVGC